VTQSYGEGHIVGSGQWAVGSGQYIEGVLGLYWGCIGGVLAE